MRGWSGAGPEHWPCLLRAAFRENPQRLCKGLLEARSFLWHVLVCPLQQPYAPNRETVKDLPRNGINLETPRRKLAGCLQKAGEVIYFSNFTAGTKALAGASVCD